MVVKVSSDTPIEDAHNVVDRIEKELRRQGIDVTVHVEPKTRNADEG